VPPLADPGGLGAGLQEIDGLCRLCVFTVREADDLALGRRRAYGRNAKLYEPIVDAVVDLFAALKARLFILIRRLCSQIAVSLSISPSDSLRRCRHSSWRLLLIL
jgi:hypothetical protein